MFQIDRTLNLNKNQHVLLCIHPILVSKEIIINQGIKLNAFE